MRPDRLWFPTKRQPAPTALAWVAMICALAPLAAWGQARNDPPPGEYRIVNGRVDRGTYTGWRLFHTACHGCHGVDATGSGVAPNLLQRVRGMSQRAFVTKVLTSYRITQLPEGNADDREAAIDALMSKKRTAGAAIVMPAWENDPSVSPHVLDLFAYLNARADGKLGPGRPKPAAVSRLKTSR